MLFKTQLLIGISARVLVVETNTTGIFTRGQFVQRQCDRIVWLETARVVNMQTSEVVYSLSGIKRSQDFLILFDPAKHNCF